MLCLILWINSELRLMATCLKASNKFTAGWALKTSVFSIGGLSWFQSTCLVKSSFMTCLAKPQQNFRLLRWIHGWPFLAFPRRLYWGTPALQVGVVASCCETRPRVQSKMVSLSMVMSLYMPRVRICYNISFCFSVAKTNFKRNWWENRFVHL